MYKKRSVQLQAGKNGEVLSLHDYRGASKKELQELIRTKNGNLAEVYLDRVAFINLLELHRSGINFSLRKANLTGIDLSSRLLPNKIDGKEAVAFVRVTGIDLSGAVLKDADLTGVLFEGCNLNKTSFRGSILDFTTYSRCDVSRAIFIDAKGLYAKQIYTSKGRTEAVYDNSKAIISGLYKIRLESQQKKSTKKPLTKRFIQAFTQESFVPTTTYIDMLDVLGTSPNIFDTSKQKTRKTLDNNRKREINARTTETTSLPSMPVTTTRTATALVTSETPDLNNTFVSRLGQGKDGQDAVRSAQMTFARLGKERRHQRRLQEQRSRRAKTPTHIF